MVGVVDNSATNPPVLLGSPFAVSLRYMLAVAS